MIRVLSTILKSVLTLALCTLAAFEIYHRARAMLYSPDEIYNTDAIVTFLTTGDYTTRSLGGFPFDPVISAGILAMWLHGLVLLLGGSLFFARLLSGIAHMIAACGIAWALLRRAGLARADAAVIAAALWVALIPVGNHDLRIVNVGELWGAIYLAAGVYFIGRSGIAAALLWGMACWLVKIIYLPFAGALLVALVVSEARERGLAPSVSGLARTTVPLVAAFFAPLLAWMTLIWLRYDAATLSHWCFAYVAFVFEHAAEVGLNGLPVYPNWSFDPDWNDAPLLSWGWAYTRSYLVPLIVAGAAILLHSGLWLLGVIRLTTREAAAFLALVVALVFELVWFFAFDPTQWGRHLMPSIYAASALALYCAVRIWGSAARLPVLSAGLAGAAYAALLYTLHTSYAQTTEYVTRVGWKASYSKTCHGLRLASPPCKNAGTAHLVRRLAKELCGIEHDPFHPEEQCMTRERARFLARAATILADPASDPGMVHAAGYMVVLVQHYNYGHEDEFLADVLPLICHAEPQPLHDRLRAAGLDVGYLAWRCDDPPAPGIGHRTSVRSTDTEGT